MGIEIILFWVIYFLLGVHSVYFYIKRATLYHDIELDFIQIIAFIISFFAPIITHLVTYISYPDPNKKPKVLFKKKEK